jgi:hypothetical protein
MAAEIGGKSWTILSRNPLRGNQLSGISELRHAKIAGSTNFSDRHIADKDGGVFVGVADLALEGSQGREGRPRHSSRLSLAVSFQSTRPRGSNVERPSGSAPMRPVRHGAGAWNTLKPLNWGQTFQRGSTQPRGPRGAIEAFTPTRLRLAVRFGPVALSRPIAALPKARRRATWSVWSVKSVVLHFPPFSSTPGRLLFSQRAHARGGARGRAEDNGGSLDH